MTAHLGKLVTQNSTAYTTKLHLCLTAAKGTAPKSCRTIGLQCSEYLSSPGRSWSEPTYLWLQAWHPNCLTKLTTCRRKVIIDLMAINDSGSHWHSVNVHAKWYVIWQCRDNLMHTTSDFEFDRKIQSSVCHLFVKKKQKNNNEYHIMFYSEEPTHILICIWCCRCVCEQWTALYSMQKLCLGFRVFIYMLSFQTLF